MATDETYVHKITNVPVFLWRLALLILMGSDPLLGPSDSTFLGLKSNSLRSLPFQGQKSLLFQGRHLPMAIEASIPTQLCIFQHVKIGSS
jgi:hypothetical protein